MTTRKPSASQVNSVIPSLRVGDYMGAEYDDVAPQTTAIQWRVEDPRCIDRSL